MIYIVTFLEGLISFISPCFLSMLPIYIAYFTCDINKKNNTILNAMFFVFGFTFVFSILGIFAGTIGALLNKYQNILNIICGIIIIIFGLNCLNILKIKYFRIKKIKSKKITGIFSSFLFGVIFGLNTTPCIGPFLGSALMLASTSSTVLKGIILLILYSLGLGIPVILTAILIKKTSTVFDFIKRNYGIINKISGVFLIILGLLVSFGIMNKIM